MPAIIKYNETAKQFIQSIYSTFGDDSTKYIDMWLAHDMNVFCVIQQNNRRENVTIALLHRIDFDPPGVYKHPTQFDYIYTYESYRNQGFALKLIQKLQRNNQLQGVCINNASKSLFKMAGCNVSPTGNFDIRDLKPQIFRINPRCDLHKLGVSPLDKTINI